MEMKYLSAPFELKREPDQDGTIEGYASVFDVVDEGMDVVNKGAFAASLATGRKVKMLWQHDMQQPIGVWDEIKEDERGLYVKGRISKDVEKGRETMALFRMGAMDSLSIGYRTVEAVPESSGRVRRLTKLDLFEISAVTIPMNEYAVAHVKAANISSPKEFEQFLRDAGYSRKEAKAITCHGFKGLDGQCDAEPNEAETEGLKALYDQIRQLQEKMTNV